MKYTRIDWLWSQEWLEVIDYDEETGEPIDDEVIPGDDCSVFVEEETYERGVNAFLDIQIARIDSE